MSFNRVMRTDFNEPAAVAAIDAVNGMIGKVAEEGAAIDAAATDLATEATQAAPETAVKVLKRVDALRVRRLANAMRELSIVPLKTTAAEAVRAAAAVYDDRGDGHASRRRAWVQDLVGPGRAGGGVPVAGALRWRGPEPLASDQATARPVVRLDSSRDRSPCHRPPLACCSTARC